MAGEIELKITTSAELAAAKESLRLMEEQAKALGALDAGTRKVITAEQLRVTVERQAAEQRKQVVAAEAALQSRIQAAANASAADRAARVSGSEVGVRSVGNLPAAAAGEAGGASALGAIGAAYAAIATAAAVFVREAAAAEAAELRLTAALDKQGVSASGVVEGYRELASALQEQTNIAAGEWIPVLTKLTQFGAKPETIGIQAEAVKNLAGLMGGDLAQAATVWGRALQGNFELLQRYGIEVDQGADYTAKLAEAMRQVRERGGGQMEANTRGITGALTTLKLGAADAAETIGRSLITAINGLTGAAGLGDAAGAANIFADAIREIASVVSGNGLINYNQEVTHAALGHERLARKVAESSTEQRQAVDPVERLTAAYRQQASAIDKTREAQDKIAAATADARVAEIDLAEKAGRLTAQEAIQARTKVRRDEEAARLSREENAKANQAIKLRNEVDDLNQAVVTAEARAAGLKGGPDKEGFAAAQREAARVRGIRDERVPLLLGQANQLQADIRTGGTVAGLRDQEAQARAAAEILGANQQANTQREAAQRQQFQGAQRALQAGAPTNIAPAANAAASGAGAVAASIEQLAAAFGTNYQSLSRRIDAITREVRDMGARERTP